jgi:hypothetical protein
VSLVVRNTISLSTTEEKLIEIFNNQTGIPYDSLAAAMKAQGPFDLKQYIWDGKIDVLPLGNVTSIYNFNEFQYQG